MLNSYKIKEDKTKEHDFYEDHSDLEIFKRISYLFYK